MDVKCERCSTEYEFDDALVSGRGTTVKCTNCGHKFKIRRSDGDFSEDFWNVTTGDGRTLVFTSLRELQRAIQGYLVERNDKLSRGGLPPKAIGQIPELAPFFDQRESGKKDKSQSQKTKTHDGLGPEAAEVRPRRPTKPDFPAPPSEPIPVPPQRTLIGTGPVTHAQAFATSSGGTEADAAPGTERQPDPPNRTAPPPRPTPSGQLRAAAAARGGRHTVPLQRPPPIPPARGPSDAPGASRGHGAQESAPRVLSASSASVPPRPISASSASVPPGAPSPSTKPASLPRVPTARPAPPAPPPMPQRSRTPVPPPVEPPRARRAEPTSDPPPLSPPPYSPRRRSLRSELEEDSYASPSRPVPRRRSPLGFIVATVLIGAALFLAVVLGQKYYGAALPQAMPEAKTIDPRVASFLANGEKALADGQLELAKESFDKASALAERDPHVLLGLARLASMRADLPWLRTRLLAPDAADDARATKESLTELSAVARRTAEDAVVVSPDDPAALRAKIDALRISGEREAARSLAPKIAASASQAETAYVLAALDLAEAEPQWPSVIERLRMAAAVETGPGRARAALAYALARSGDAAGAQAEVERLAAMPKAHPLLPLLRGLVERSRVRDAGVAVTAVVDAGKGARPGAAGAPGAGGDARDLVVQGERARAKGDFDRARALFSQALERNPNDSEALAGLGAVAYAQRDLAAARASYKRVLSVNPNYMPALIGLADVEWDSGDKAAAIKMYKDIVANYPPGTYPGRVQQRSEGG
jgi:predicted Zn finger-like uncharacterized protein